MILIAALVAAAPLAGAQLQHEAEEHARAEANELLRTLCPEQCAVLSVSARVEEEDARGYAGIVADRRQADRIGAGARHRNIGRDRAARAGRSLLLRRAASTRWLVRRPRS